MAGFLLLENLNIWHVKLNDRVTLEDNYRKLILLCYIDNAIDENFRIITEMHKHHNDYKKELDTSDY